MLAPLALTFLQVKHTDQTALLYMLLETKPTRLVTNPRVTQ